MYDPKEPEPMFVMSMYMNKETLLEAKCKHLQEKVDYLEERLAIDTLNPNRREHIIELVERLRVAEADAEPLTKLDENGYEVPDNG